MIIISTHLFSAGSDYIKTSEVFSGAEIISINVTVLEDVLVELPELFFVIGHINPRFVDDIPVSSVDANITIVSAPGRFKLKEYNLSWSVCVYFNNSFECTVHLLLQTHSQYSNFEFGCIHRILIIILPHLFPLPSLLYYLCPSSLPLPLSPSSLSYSLFHPPPSPPSLFPLPYPYFTARIRFEEIVYPTSELAGSVDVCVAVTNGIMDFDLPVNIDVLTMSTAVGRHFKCIPAQYIQCIYTCR